MAGITKDKVCQFCGKKLNSKIVQFQCPKCKQWNIPTSGVIVTKTGKIDDGTMLLHEVPDYDVPRLLTGPWDSNFGDPPGVPEDSVTIVGGAPGAGKSTFALQLSDAMVIGARKQQILSKQLGPKKEVLYLCAEEGKKQIKARYTRLGGKSRGVRIVPLEKMQDINLESILTNHSLCGVILDSIAAFTNDPNEATEIVSRFKTFAELFRIPFIVINHVTKDGAMAGMMKLQHAGDISMMLTKGEKDVVERVRFPSSEIALLDSEDRIRSSELSDDSDDESSADNDEDGFEGDDDSSDEDEDDGIDAEDTFFEMTEVRELYTEKSRYGPSGISTFFAMTERGLIQVEFEPDVEG
jgi:predicted ATP-dependent serine protease